MDCRFGMKYDLNFIENYESSIMSGHFKPKIVYFGGGGFWPIRNSFLTGRDLSGALQGAMGHYGGSDYTSK